MPELVQLLVDVGVLLDVGVGPGQVGLWLVVVVVADEVLDRVVRQELLELRGELGGEGLVVGDDQRGTLYPLGGAGHREGLATAGHAHEGLVAHALLDAFDNSVYGLGLVAGGPEVRGYPELAGDLCCGGHGVCIPGRRSPSPQPSPVKGEGAFSP